jgi:hypothetical protein
MRVSTSLCGPLKVHTRSVLQGIKILRGELKSTDNEDGRPRLHKLSLFPRPRTFYSAAHDLCGLLAGEVRTAIAKYARRLDFDRSTLLRSNHEEEIWCPTFWTLMKDDAIPCILKEACSSERHDRMLILSVKRCHQLRP